MNIRDPATLPTLDFYYRHSSHTWSTLVNIRQEVAGSVQLHGHTLGITLDSNCGPTWASPGEQGARSRPPGALSPFSPALHARHRRRLPAINLLTDELMWSSRRTSPTGQQSWRCLLTLRFHSLRRPSAAYSRAPRADPCRAGFPTPLRKPHSNQCWTFKNHFPAPEMLHRRGGRPGPGGLPRLYASRAPRSPRPRKTPSRPRSGRLNLPPPR